MEDRARVTAFDLEGRTLYVSGTIDELSAVHLRDDITKYSSDHTENLTVDLVDVDLLPSVGVGVLAVAIRQAEGNGAAIELVARKETIVQRVLNICGMPFRER